MNTKLRDDWSEIRSGFSKSLSDLELSWENAKQDNPSDDGALLIEEIDELYRSFTRSRMVDALQALDSDGDGQIAPEELDTRIARLVERRDGDGDGAPTLQRPGAPQGDN
ncbi:hypothetical protein SAMN04488040_2776 [Sulfitobacter marinus]|uniref:EF-hand domain-containing protein n=1 Tax=Sulfitobacter marinus TaxID=394264 RepID=A0A1I6UJF4_9RHOB|nr:hypothetical protein [Sulfitobacter marinus]SFT01595.1 hypothetical protein SAMN04488040_2776 [Sulfitobacter marinus]